MSVNPTYVSIDCKTITVSGAGKPHRNSIERKLMLTKRRERQVARDWRSHWRWEDAKEKAAVRRARELEAWRERGAILARWFD